MDKESQEHINEIAPIVSTAYKLGQEQKFEEAYKTLLPYFEANEIPTYFEQPCGWAIYRYLKHEEDKISTYDIRRALFYYLNFASCKPSLLHSYIMLQAVNFEKKHENNFKFIEFCLMWKLDSLRPEDFLSAKGTTDNGKSIEFPSLAENVATRLYKELKSRHTEEFINELFPFFLMVKEKCSDNRFIDMYIAQLLYWQGKLDESLAAYKAILRNSPEWYIWKSMGDIIDDKDLRISFYCKALTMMGKDEYIVDLRLKLATLLLDSNKEQAAYELEQYMKTYKENNWNISSDVYLLQSKTQSVIPSSQSKAFYRSNLEAAEDYAYSDIPTEEFVLVEIFKNHEGKERAKLTNTKRHLDIKMPVTPPLRKATPGEVFSVRLTKKNERWVPLTIHKTGKSLELKGKKVGSQDSSEIKTITGIVSLPVKGDFCFIDHAYYVPAKIRETNKLQEGQQVTAKVKQLPDGKWRVVSIIGGI